MLWKQKTQIPGSGLRFSKGSGQPLAAEFARRILTNMDLGVGFVRVERNTGQIWSCKFMVTKLATV